MGGNALLVLLDIEIGQVQFVRIQPFAIDTGLDLFDLMLLQGWIDIGTGIGAIGVERLQPGAFLQVG